MGEAGVAAGEALDEGIARSFGEATLRRVKQIRGRIEALLADIKAGVGVTLDEKDVAEIRAMLEGALEGLSAEVGVDVDKTEELETVAQLDEIAHTRDVQYEPKVDKTDFTKLKKDLDQFGKDTGIGFGDSFVSGLSLKQQAIGLAIAGFAEPAGVLLQGAAGGLAQIFSSAFAAGLGGLGASAGIFAGLATTIGAVVVGAKGMPAAFKAIGKEAADAAKEGRGFNASAKEIQDTLKGLAPEARSFALAFADLVPPLQELQRSVQGRLFAGLDESLRSLATHTLPRVRRALEDAADVANQFFKDLAHAVNTIHFDELFAGLKPATRDVANAFLAMVQSFEPFIRAVTPAANLLAGYLHSAATALGDMINRGAASGALTNFFTSGVESLKLWAQLLGEIGKALFTVFQLGAAGGDSMIGKLTDIVREFNAWLKSAEGENAVTKFFADSRQILEALGPLIQGVGKFFEGLISEGSIGRFQETTRLLGAILGDLGELLGIVGRANLLNAFLELIAGIGKALEPVMPQLEKLADIFGVGISKGVQDVVKLFGDFVEALKPVLDLLVGPGAGAVENLVRFATAAFLLSGALGFLAKVIFGFPLKILLGVVEGLEAMQKIKASWPALVELAGALGALAVPLAIVAILVGAFVIAWLKWDQILDILKSAWEWFTKLNTPMKILVGTLAALTVALNPFVQGAAAILLLVAAFKNLDAVVGFLQGVGKAILDFFTNLPKVIGDAVQALPGALANVGQAILDFAAK